MVVLDESSSFKNSQSKRFKSLKLVRSRIRRFVELTGTPASNGLKDLWAQIYLLDGGARLVGDMYISMRTSDYITLPDVIYNDIPVSLKRAACAGIFQFSA